ncbi:hypothetical protein MYP_238 [Sporocytophaga myxococcoides]|uniref:Uncharacterized protein n=1 Tax=Sporocytophaga myxococcoides TaxID=153721 RepID=A0A098L8W0_9BACT|nr:hypothetical protein [Sporocytophaga myxococcoides]GAL83012.1 hypothetical protein MYP_238 [Sporocytophaga myxococcoides]
MPENKEEIEHLAGMSLIQEFGLSTSNDLNSSLDALIAALSKAIGQLLQTQPEKLFQILYRLDVNESIVKKTFQEKAGEELCLTLAQKMVERQIQRIQIRQKYSGKSPEDSHY